MSSFGDVRYGAPLRIAEVKAAGDGAWEVAGYASTFGNVDLGNDVIRPGAFAKALASGARVRLLYSHNPADVLGVPLALTEDEKGLHGRFKLSKTRLGEDVHTLLKDGALDSFSIGYIPTDFEVDEDTGTRHLKEVELLEVSVVAMPMNPLATVTGVKSRLAEGEAKAEWDAAYVSALPDSAFAVILPGGEKDDTGRTTPRSLRKLPHHNASGAVDMPHLRNALSRESQTDIPEAAHRRARAHLMRHARAAGMGDADEDALPIGTLLDIASLEGDDALRAVRALWERRRSDGREPSDRVVALVDEYRQKRQREADDLLALLTESAPAPAEETAAETTQPPAEGGSPKAAGLVEAYLRRARLKRLARKYADVVVPEYDEVAHLERLAPYDPLSQEGS